MGFLKQSYGMTLLGKTPEGTCPECAVAHDPAQPHNHDSLAYQYKFYDKHGRWPTWSDAMAHCSADVKAVWTKELAKHKIIIREIKEMRHCRVCGCTDARACPGGCYWVKNDLCSCCAGKEAPDGR